MTYAVGIQVVEQGRFHVIHCQIGARQAEAWNLPAPTVAAIAGHLCCASHLDEPLESRAHGGEALSNALDLSGRQGNRVTGISSAARRALGLECEVSVRPLFGSVEARNRHANCLLIEQNYAGLCHCHLRVGLDQADDGCVLRGDKSEQAWPERVAILSSWWH